MPNNDEKLIMKLLDEVEQEYSTRYQWGDNASECMSLFRKVRSKLQDKIFSAYKSNPELSADGILSLVSDFLDRWPNSSTDCDDTDGTIYITSIYSKLQDGLEGVTRQNEPASNDRRYFTTKFLVFYISFLTVLFVSYIYLVG